MPARPHLLHVFSNFVPTGPELRTVQLIEAFGNDFRHSIVSMDGRIGATERLPRAADARVLPNPPNVGSLATAFRLRRLLRREKPDLVLTYNWGAFDMVLAARGLGFRRLVHHEEGFNEDEAVRFKLRRVLARRLVLPWAHRIVVPSRVLHSVATEIWKLPPGKVRLIPNGIHLDRFAPADGHPGLRDRLGIPRDAIVVGGVGSLRAVKNHFRLLEACAAVPAAHLLLVGDGKELPALQSRAAAPDLAGRVHFAGYQADTAPYYRAMDVFALSSDSEQLPVSLLEAMASSLPVAATDVGDVRTVLPPDQSSLLAAPGAEAAAVLARAIASLSGSPDARRRLGGLNRQQVESSYTFEAMCAAYQQIYRWSIAV